MFYINCAILTVAALFANVSIALYAVSTFLSNSNNDFCKATMSILLFAHINSLLFSFSFPFINCIQMLKKMNDIKYLYIITILSGIGLFRLIILLQKPKNKSLFFLSYCLCGYDYSLGYSYWSRSLLIGFGYFK